MKSFLLIASLALLQIFASAQEENKNYSEAFTIIEVWLDAQKDFDQLPCLLPIRFCFQKQLCFCS